MSHGTGLDGELFQRLHDIDLETAKALQRAGCPHCGGRLDRADFPRKARGVPGLAEALFERRFGLCCAREGCRKRVLPPSVRFLGRKIYSAIAIVVTCICEAARHRWQERRRIARWLAWWREVFVESATFITLRGRLSVAVDIAELPGSLLARVAGTGSEQLVRFLALVAGVAPPAHGS